MKTNSMNIAAPANPSDANRQLAHDGLQVLKDWKNDFGHVPFNSFDDGQIPLSQAQGMIEVLASLFSAGSDDAEQPSEVTNICDSSVAAALSGINTLLNLSRLEADSFDYRKAQKRGRAA